MTAQLASPLNEKDIDYTDPSNKELFFHRRQLDDLRVLQARESAPIGHPGSLCKPNLFFGFFHDGTRNNYGASIKKGNRAHTNVARLYSCFPGNLDNHHTGIAR